MGEKILDTISWYAARVINGKDYVRVILARAGIEVYNTRVVPNIFFVHCTQAQMRYMAFELFGKFAFYRDPERREAQPIDESQMKAFIIVTSAPDGEVILLDKPAPEFLQGERVRVISGPFKGSEGVVKRVKGDRRLVVCIEGIAAVATSYIPPQNLEKITD